MSARIILIRGINVGGKNAVPMAGLRELLAELGCTDVVTHLASGNAIVSSELARAELSAKIEKALPARFHLDDERVKVLTLTGTAFRSIVDDRPAGFGDEPTTYHSDAIFLLGIGVSEAMAVFDPREGVDAVWPGDGVIYHQRLSSQRTRSRLSKIVGTPAYASMTLRSWATTQKLLALLGPAARYQQPDDP